MQTDLLPASPDDQAVIAHLLQLYLHDLRDFGGPPIDKHGRFPAAPLTPFWSEPHHYPYLIHAGGQLAGFALACRRSRIHASFDGHTVADFFVLRGYRDRGVGTAAASQLFDALPGRWELATPAANIPAIAFWRSVSQCYTSGAYEEIWATQQGWRGAIQSFDAPAAAEERGARG